jgi:energy-coupling factor transporter ATP-binding protein EcfA2
VAHLIGGGTLSAETAATVWLTLEHGASMFVVAGPQGAGKSTLATALLAFLPSDSQVYVTSGPRDPLTVEDPERTYMLVNELSWHLPMYLSGPAAQRAFELLSKGARIIGTLHARSVREAFGVMGYEANISAKAIAAAVEQHPMLIVVLEARRTNSGIERRVVDLGLARGVDAEQISLEGAGSEALANWLGGDRSRVQDELDARAAWLQTCVRDRVTEPIALASGIAQYRLRHLTPF